MFLDERPYTFDRVFRLIVTGLTIAGALILLGYLSDVLTPFAVALLLAYLLNPLVERVNRRVKSQPLAVGLTLAGAAAVLILAVALITPLVLGEIGHMGRLLKELVENSEVAKRAAEKLPPDWWATLKSYAAREDVRNFFRQDSFVKAAEAALRKVLPGAWGLIAGTFNLLLGLLGLFTVGLYLVFLLLDYRKVSAHWPQLIPPAWREPLIAFLRDVDAGMNRYFRAQALVAFIVGVLHAIGFWLVGLPLSILLGLFIGLLNMVPYLQLVSVPLALGLAVLHALETGASLWLMLGLTAMVFVCVQLLQDGVLVPRIMGQAMGLSPAAILLSLSIWGKLLGFFGLLVAIPLTCILLAYYRRLLDRGGPPPLKTAV